MNYTELNFINIIYIQSIEYNYISMINLKVL